MAKRRKYLTELKFEGPRFEDSGLDIDVLPELVSYKKILVATAKELWREKHPDRQRLPRNFEDSLSIKFSEIRSGSAVVPLYRDLVERPGEFILEERDELDEAVTIVDEGILAIEHDQKLPSRFPRDILPLVADLGSSLAENESIVIKSPNRQSGIRYTQRVRQRVATWIIDTFQDEIDVVGEVRGAEIDGNSFVIRLEDGSKARGRFEPAWEAIITEGLRDHASRKLHLTGLGEFSREDGYLQKIVQIDELALIEEAETLKESDTAARPIWEVVSEIGAQVPDQEWSKLPVDLAENLDQYLYGGRKKTGK